MEDSGKQDFLIDGFPRNENNLQGWQKAMDDKTTVKFVLFFDCPEEVFSFLSNPGDLVLKTVFKVILHFECLTGLCTEVFRKRFD